jgi:hypothetical protein
MKTTRLFRYLWRINGVLIFLASLLAVLVLGYIAIQFLDFGKVQPEQAVQVDAEPEAEAEPPTLGTFQQVCGFPWLRAELTFGDRYRYAKFSSGGSFSTRNCMFFNPETAEARWLFPGEKQLIVETDQLLESIPGEDPDRPDSRAIAFCYQTIEKDTNGDKQLTPDDLMSITYSRPDGREYTSVIEGIERVLNTSTIAGGKKHMVVYEAGGKWLTAIVTLADFEIESAGELPTR